MKRYKFDLGGSYVLYAGVTLGAAIAAFMRHWPSRIEEVISITELPIQDYEMP
jgi:hypothetical protein